MKPPSSKYVSSARASVGQKAAAAASSAAVATAAATTKAKQKKDAASDSIKEREFDSVKAIIDSVARKEIKKSLSADPWMPPIIVSKFDEIWAQAYPLVMAEVKDGYMASVGSESKVITEQIKEELDLSTWPPPPDIWRPLAWFRSKILYSVNPADKTIWYIMQSHHAVFLLLAVCPFGVNCVYWLAFLLFMDKHDEYQIVSFIVSTRTLWLVVYGLGPLLVAFFSFSVCALQAACDTGAPGTSDASLFSALAMDVNVLCSWYLFACYRRTRVARLARHAEAVSEHKAGRLRVLPKFREATVVRMLLAYDVILFVLVKLVEVLLLTFLVPRGNAPYASSAVARIGGIATFEAAWESRIVVRLAQVALSLAYIPWALLSIPGIDFLVLKLHKTGYDHEGRVHLRLSTKNMARKWAKETEEKKTLRQKAGAAIGRIGNSLSRTKATAAHAEGRSEQVRTDDDRSTMV